MSELAQIVIATSNTGKFKEIRAALLTLQIKLLSLQDCPGVPEAPEEGDTFEQIAKYKAVFYYDQLQVPVIAEDSGLVIPALNDYPGIYSARIAATDQARIQLILQKMSGKKDRSAFYHCSMVFKTSELELPSAGRCEGRILEAPRGTSGFGYDPIFQPEHHDRTFAEMDLEEKAPLSHRGRALQKLLPALQEWVYSRS